MGFVILSAILVGSGFIVGLWTVNSGLEAKVEAKVKTAVDDFENRVSSIEGDVASIKTRDEAAFIQKYAQVTQVITTTASDVKNDVENVGATVTSDVAVKVAAVENTLNTAV